MRNYTSLEQSKRLIAAGLDPNTADMFYIPLSKNYIHVGDAQEREQYNFDTIPCWSVGALIELLPKYIYSKEATYQLKMDFDEGSCIIYYEHEGRPEHLYYYDGTLCGDENFVESLIHLVLWLLKKGYIKKGE